jgi:hypothetical protein
LRPRTPSPERETDTMSAPIGETFTYPVAKGGIRPEKGHLSSAARIPSNRWWRASMKRPVT